MSDGDVYATTHTGQPSTSWTRYHSSDIITVCHCYTRHSPQWIADRIAEAVADHKQRDAE